MTVTPGELVEAVLRAPFGRRTRRELWYALAGLVPACAAALLIVTLLGAGIMLTASLAGAFAGLLILVLALRLARSLGSLQRRMAGWLLGRRFPAPEPFRPARGVLRRVDTRLRDGTAWRAVGYLMLKLPVAALQAYAASFWVLGVLDIFLAVWWPVLGHPPPGGPPAGFTVITPLFFGFRAGTGAGALGAALAGALSLLAAPWVLRATTAGDAWLIRDLLGPARLDERVRELEESRAHAVDDAAAALRQVERDLHDGAQVRLAALAMGLGMAREKLGDDGQPVEQAQVAAVRDLVAAAHQHAKEALVELRDLARGIHPPVLDAGLADALATLAARSLLPAGLSTDITERPSPAIETIAYFCAAELLANAAKHSGADKVTIDVTERGGTLRLHVSDDGAGGADPARGSGLAGLAQRVATVDGRLRLSSPPGGPTVVTVELPLRA